MFDRDHLVIQECNERIFKLTRNLDLLAASIFAFGSNLAPLDPLDVISIYFISLTLVTANFFAISCASLLLGSVGFQY